MALNTPADIISYARGLWSITTGQYPDEKAIIDFNNVFLRVVELLTQEVDEGYFGNFITSETFENQVETYLYDEVNKIYVNKINRVFIRYSDTDKYIQAKEVNREYLERDEEWYASNQPKESPIYYVFDNSIFVYPKPDANTTSWLKLDASLLPGEKDLNDTLEINRAIKFLVAEWLLPYIFKRRLMRNDEAIATEDFEEKLNDTIYSLKERVATPQEIEEPNLDHLT